MKKKSFINPPHFLIIQMPEEEKAFNELITWALNPNLSKVVFYYPKKMTDFVTNLLSGNLIGSYLGKDNLEGFYPMKLSAEELANEIFEIIFTKEDSETSTAVVIVDIEFDVVEFLDIFANNTVPGSDFLLQEVMRKKAQNLARTFNFEEEQIIGDINSEDKITNGLPVEASYLLFDFPLL